MFFLHGSFPPFLFFNTLNTRLFSACFSFFQIFLITSLLLYLFVKHFFTVVSLNSFSDFLFFSIVNPDPVFLLLDPELKIITTGTCTGIILVISLL